MYARPSVRACVCIRYVTLRYVMFIMLSYVMSKCIPTCVAGRLKGLSWKEMIECCVLSVRAVDAKPWIWWRAWIVCGWVTEEEMADMVGVPVEELRGAIAKGTEQQTASGPT